MEQDFFGKLPPEITIEILSRLPVQIAVTCKCVCKPWLDLVKTSEFAKSHLSKSSPGLAVFHGEFCPKPYTLFEYVDDRELAMKQRFNYLVNISFPHSKLIIHSSTDGLLLLYDCKKQPRNLFIFNPITREYIKIPGPKMYSFSNRRTRFNTFGFGASKTTLVRIYDQFFEPKCRVYTLGTGSWREIGSGYPLRYACNSGGALLNGKLHWLAWDMDQSPWISCFDIETELVGTFSSPRLEGDRVYKALSVLRECLCLYDNSADDETVVIWLMNECGDEKSWRKEFIVNSCGYEAIIPIKVFKDGVMLIVTEGWDRVSRLCFYSSETMTIRGTSLIDSFSSDCLTAVSYTPSFLPLKTFKTDNVSSF